MGYDDNYFERGIAEQWFNKNGLLRPDQLAALCYVFDLPYWRQSENRLRKPGTIVSMGCGLGFLEKKIEDMGFTVIGVDPYFAEQYIGSRCEKLLPNEPIQTLVFCEAIEHISKKEILDAIAGVSPGGRVIITNWADFHPIPVDGTGWDHITRIDDELYDELTNGRKVIIRRGSHLVFEI